MNPLLGRLNPYPFEKLAELKSGVQADASFTPINLSIGEPKHPAPDFVLQALHSSFEGLSQYPATRGLPELRATVAAWLVQRLRLPALAVDPDRHVLPCSGTREALFAFAQAVVDSRDRPKVLMPNPFYQIYEGAALLAGAEPYFLNTTAANGYLPDFEAVPDSVWRDCQLTYVCSPGNPAGSILSLERFKRLIQLAEHFDFVIASDECYSELYRDETAPPPGLLEAAHSMGNDEFKRCVSFHSLSKRSNLPGLRSGFVAGDASLLEKFLLYRTYHGCAPSIPVQRASIVAWQDEDHVVENRRHYRAKFAAVTGIIGQDLDVETPTGGFYLWLRTPCDDRDFCRELYRRGNLTVLPGSFLSRMASGFDPGQNHVRAALVPSLDECVAAAERIRDFVQSLNS